MTATKVKWQNIDLNDLFSHNYVLWENISAAGPVSLLPDGKIYKLSNNIRTLYALGGYSLVKSILLPNNKIISACITSAQIWIYVWTIDNATNTITYWTGVQATTNYTWGLEIAKAWTDSACLFYSNSWTKTAYCRAISISWTVPTLWVESNITTWFYGADPVYSCYVAPWKCAVWVFVSNNGSAGGNIYIIGVSWTVATVWWVVSVAWSYTSIWIHWMTYISDNVIAASWDNQSRTYMYCITVSWTTPTAWAGIDVWNASNPNGRMVSDWTYLYNTYYSQAWPVVYLQKHSISWNTLTNIFNITITELDWICCIGTMIGILWWTTIKWYSVDWSTAVLRNTINYWTAMPYLYMNNRSDNYLMINTSWSPAYMYKIGNEERGLIWYLSTPGSYGDTRGISIDGETIVTTNLEPWSVYYTSAGGTIDSNGVQKFWRALGTTSMKLEIDIS
jgi:hypothetical protein